MLVMTRRTFTLGATGLAALGRLNARGKIPIAVQLWSVRKLCEKDLAGTLAGLAKAGYQGVEFAGYYGRTAKELRKLLDDNGLRCCGTHTALNTLLGDELPRTIEFNQILGNRNLVVPSLPEKYRSSRQAWIDTAKLFAELAEKVRPHKMRVGYHNHMVEFKPLDGEVPWDIFFQNTSKEVIMQIDTANCMMGGGDPIAYIRKYPGRAITVHIKEYSASKRDALIGEGDVNWKEFFAACESVGGTEWYIVEEESGAYPGLEAVTRSLQNLRKMGK
jgi:sugar phosphate isomerase/epimerase